MLESPATRDTDTQALHAECGRCRATLYRIALLQLRDHDAAEDAVQETLVAAIAGRAGFRGQSSIKTWLLAISCRDTTVLVSDGRDRPLTAEELADLRGHLTGCVRCQAARGQFEILFHGIDRYLHGDTPDAPVDRGTGV